MQRQDSVSCGGRAVEVSCGGRGETARAVEHAWRTLEIWERRKGRVMVCRGGETESVYFFHSLSNSLTRSVFTELTEFDQVWSSLTEFDHFRVFNSILHVICELTRKIVRFYESTRDFDNNGWRVRLQFLSEK